MTARIARWILAAQAAATRLPAALAPRWFYNEFPLGRAWVAMLSPYNQHLVTDVGGSYAAFALLFAWAATTLQRTLIVPVCAAWAMAALLHFGYHAARLDGWNVGDAIAQTVALALVLALPAVAIAASRPAPI